MMTHTHPEGHMTLLLYDHAPAVSALYEKGDHPQ